MFNRTLIIVTMITTSLCSIGQDVRSDGRYYLEKSKRQEKGAVVTLALGGATLIPGLLLLNDVKPGWEHVNWNKALGGSGLVIAGTGLVISSIVLFISSNGNKRKADRIGVFVNRPIEINKGLALTTLPYSVGFTIPIR
jgi:hypothetical protein